MSKEETDEDPWFKPFNLRDYLPPSEAVELILPYVDTLFEAKQAIVDGLHSSRVRSIAETIWSSASEKLRGDWDPDLAAEDYQVEVQLDREFYSQSFQWPSEVTFWRWDDGEFVIFLSNYDAAEQHCTYIQGVRLHRGDVLSLVGKGSRAGIGGRPRKDHEWRAFWHALVKLARDGKLSQFRSQAELREEILTRIHERLSDEAIKPEVKLLWEFLTRSDT